MTEKLLITDIFSLFHVQLVTIVQQNRATASALIGPSEIRRIQGAMDSFSLRSNVAQGFHHFV